MTLLQYFGKSSFHYQAISLKIQKEIKLRYIWTIFVFNEVRSVVIMYVQPRLTFLAMMMVFICDINMFFLLLYGIASCVFNIGFILLICDISLIISLKLLSALSIISMSEASIMCPGFSSLWQRMADSLFLPLCSLIRRASMRSVLPM